MSNMILEFHDYDELETVAAGLSYLIKENRELAKQFKKCGLPDLATPQLQTAERILYRLRQIKEKYPMIHREATK